MNIIKLIKYIKKVGLAKFSEEFKIKAEERAGDPKIALRLQTQGLVGVILFSFVTAIIFAWNGIWTIAGLFMFNILVMSGQLMSTRKNLKMYLEIED